MSEAEIIGGGIASKLAAVSRADKEPTHDWRKVKRSNPGDTAGAEAANARAQSFAPTEPAL